MGVFSAVRHSVHLCACRVGWFGNFVCSFDVCIYVGFAVCNRHKLDAVDVYIIDTDDCCSWLSEICDPCEVDTGAKDRVPPSLAGQLNFAKLQVWHRLCFSSGRESAKATVLDPVCQSKQRQEPPKFTRGKIRPCMHGLGRLACAHRSI
jgi:hypothetical protein